MLYARTVFASVGPLERERLACGDVLHVDPVEPAAARASQVVRKVVRQPGIEASPLAVQGPRVLEYLAPVLVYERADEPAGLGKARSSNSTGSWTRSESSLETRVAIGPPLTVGRARDRSEARYLNMILNKGLRARV